MKHGIAIAETATDKETANVSTPFTRRDWLMGGLLVGSVLGASGCPTDPGDDDDTEPPPGDPVVSKAERMLVDRATFGRNLEELALVAQLGYEGYLEYQLDYETIDDSAVEAKLGRFPTLNMTTKQIFDRVARGQNDAVEHLVSATILRSAYSKRQLYQKMVEFWTDHFNIYVEKEGQNFVKPVDDREVIRKHALGNFRDLLSASAHSPAMLAYLDNATSAKEAPNENYARELEELHTIGVDNFTQQDVKEVARCFTGWSINLNIFSQNLGTFQYRGILHDNGPKTVLGNEIPAGGGMQDGEIVLDILTSDPNIAPLTARFLAGKMAKYFWGEHPPEGMIADIANAYLSTNGDIRAMVRAALNRDWITDAPPKLKRPYHLVMSSLRGIDTEIKNFLGVRIALYIMGHHPFEWPAPNGYPDSDIYWSGLLLPRWRYGALLFLQENQVVMDLDSFMAAGTVDEFMTEVERIIYGNKMSKKDKTFLGQYLESFPNSEFRRLETLGLSMSASGFQWF